MGFRRSELILPCSLLLASLAGCCGLLNPAARLHGKWKLDVDATIDRAAGGNDVQAGLARAAWGMFGGDIVVEFRSDGTGAFTGKTLAGGGTEEGKWTLKSAEGDTLVIEFTPDGSGQPREVEILMTGPDSFEVSGRRRQCRHLSARGGIARERKPNPVQEVMNERHPFRSLAVLLCGLILLPAQAVFSQEPRGASARSTD